MRIKGPSVGFQWKYKAHTSSFEYVDSLNLSLALAPTYSLRSITLITGGLRYSAVDCMSLLSPNIEALD